MIVKLREEESDCFGKTLLNRYNIDQDKKKLMAELKLF